MVGNKEEGQRARIYMDVARSLKLRSLYQRGAGAGSRIIIVGAAVVAWN